MTASKATVRRLLLRAAFVALCAAEAAPAQDAQQRATPTVQAEHVIVTGLRASLATAQDIKRNRFEFVDAVIADDIGKLPDFSVTEALSRVPGVQIARDRGEGFGVTIRGLQQVETTLNGREVFTAGTQRSLELATVPAPLVAGIDVYKSASAAQLEGGLGGLIDLRTYRPFDFDGLRIAGNTHAVHGDLIDETKPQVSLLLADRRRSAGAGEFGALLNVSYQERAWREDQKSAGNPSARTDLLAGQTIIAPNGTSETTSAGTRERTGASLILQWRPAAALELYAEGHYAQMRTIQDSHQINVSPFARAAPTFEPGSVELFPGTNHLQHITWTNAPISILSFARDTVDRTSQTAIGAVWTGEALRLKADLSHAESFSDLFFSGPVLGAVAAGFTHDLSGRIPATTVTGTDLLDPANFAFSSIAFRYRPFEGDLTALRLDGDYRLDAGWLGTVSAGLRFAQRRATNAPGLIFADAAVSGIAASDRPQFIMPNPYNDFFPGQATPSIRNFIVGNLDASRDAAGLRSAFGVTAPIPASGNPLSVWQIDERTDTAYVMANFEADRAPLDGNFGLRVVRTREAVAGTQSVPAAGGTAPVDIAAAYTDALPSANLRYRPREGWVLRAAASKTLTRQPFDQLSPSLTLIRNTVNPDLNVGSAGNPALRPIRSDNFDLGVERYIARGTSVHLALFKKRVDGFVSTVSAPEVHDGETYQVSRPQQTGMGADIKGFEIGYQQFYDFLPGWMSGLGLQANYTYVDSTAPSPILGRDAPLQGLSPHSLNLIGMYERGPVSARVAYNWRDKFIGRFASFVGVGSLAVYTRAYSWLDASVTYRFNDRVSLALEGTNLLGTMRRSYYEVETRPESNWVNDRQIGVMLAVRFG